MKRSWRAAGLLVAALVLGVCATLLGKPPGDHLIVDPSVFGSPGANPYEDELARLLLPVGSRELQMVWIPSWQPEGAVYVEKTSEQNAPESFRVVLLELPRNLASQVMERQVARKLPDGTIPFTPADFRAAIEALKPVPARYEVPISSGTVSALRRVWHGALRGARQRTPEDGVVVDGTSVHFAQWDEGVGYLAASADALYPGSRCEALVKLGDELARLAKAAPSERNVIEARIILAAKALEKRF